MDPMTADATISADITYTVDTGEKLINETFTKGGEARLNTGTYEQRLMRIRDGRAAHAALSIDISGFRLVEHRSAIADFLDKGQLESVYYPEMVELVKTQTGASRVVVFDHTLRSGDKTQREAQRLREVILSAHNDYTEWSDRSGCAISYPKKQRTCSRAASPLCKCGDPSIDPSWRIR